IPRAGNASSSRPSPRPAPTWSPWLPAMPTTSPTYRREPVSSPRTPPPQSRCGGSAAGPPAPSIRPGGCRWTSPQPTAPCSTRSEPACPGPPNADPPTPRAPGDPMDRRQFLAASGLGVAAAAAWPATAAARPGAASRPPGRADTAPTVQVGAERWAADGWSALSGHRVGVISNPTGILTDTSHIVDSMVASGNVNITGVFGPEHGFRGSAQAGDSEDTFTDPRTGVTVYDAYGAQEAHFMNMFAEADVEVVVFDIQDVGARFYTYIWTMWSAMRAASSE